MAQVWCVRDASDKRANSSTRLVKYQSQVDCEWRLGGLHRKPVVAAVHDDW